MLHNQIDGLLSAIAQRPTEIKSELAPEQGAKPSFGLGRESIMNFKIDMVGDSTMRVRCFTYRWTLITHSPRAIHVHRLGTSESGYSQGLLIGQ